MDIGDRTVWQVSAGDTNREYVDILLHWGVIVDGPGKYGPFSDEALEAMESDGVSAKKRKDLQRFRHDMKENDIVVLRVGTKTIYAVGVVDFADYQWLDDFGDMDGWDLQHTRRVRWILKYDSKAKRKTGLKELKKNRLNWGDTVQKVKVKENRELEELLESPQLDYESGSLPKLPESLVDGKVIEKLQLNEIYTQLYDCGIDDASIKSLLKVIENSISLSEWYKRTDEKKVSEYETVSYMVIPFLRALGWTPQRMALEWNNIDIALFNNDPRTNKNLSVVVEAKRRNISCLTARGQATGYANNPEREKCKRIILTDGIRFGVLLRGEDGHFPKSPTAYLNLSRFVDSYPILGMGKQCGGAIEAIRLMFANYNVT